MSDTAVVVVNYGWHTLLAGNLPARDALGVARVVVVDNPAPGVPGDALAALARERSWDLLPMTTNVGFGAAMNAGATHALATGCRTLVLLNPDLSVAPEVVTALAAAARDDERLLVSPRIVRPDGSVWFTGGEVLVEAGRTVTRGADSTSPTGWLTGACLALSAALWQAAGGFDEDYFLYWEDVDLSWRCRAAGGRLEVRPDLHAVHDVGGTQGGKSTGYVRWNCRNRLVFATKHLAPADRWRWVLRSPGYARLVLRRAGVDRRVLRHGGMLAASAVGTAQGVATVIRATLPRYGRQRGPGSEGFTPL